MLPCLSENSLNLFSVTADERFTLGSDIFIRTHSPIKMRRFSGNQEIDSWSEHNILQSLEQSQLNGTIGNRTYVFYGAAGSGKSEIIRWLQHMLASTPRSPFILRISRTELDPVKILEKILWQFSGIGLTQGVLQHWDGLKKKPVTLANHLVWSALGKMFDNDEKIIPLSYKLRPIIEESLKTNFFTSNEDVPTAPPELISIEQLEKIIEDCCFDCNINCEQLQSLMIRELEQQMFGDYNFIETLRRIGNEVFQKTGIRPLLLIDDLVQSLNVFASDLLDFFITLDEGNWDIIIGLTPASFESTKRGRELLNRITNLDTFDDRMMKLWFSNEQGSQSYFLDADNCTEYAARYIQEAKRQSGYNCDDRCIHINYCTTLHEGSAEALILFPFSVPSLKRMFLNIPENKGRPRHFISSMGNVLNLYLNKKYTLAWEHYFKREYAPACEDPNLRLLLSVYALPIAGQNATVLVNPALVLFFFPTISQSSLPGSVQLTPLSPMLLTHSTLESSDSLDPSKTTIRDWLDGRPVNKELLRDVRQGLVSVCRDVGQPNNLGIYYSPRQRSTVHVDKNYEGCKIALFFEDADEENPQNAIVVNRTLGHATFLFENVHSLRGYTKEKQLSLIFSQDIPFDLLYQTDTLRRKTEQRLEKELGMHPSDFAFCCFSLLLEIGQADQELPPFLHSLPQYQYSDEFSQVTRLPPDIVNLIYQQFKDWFLLRENIYDGPSIEARKKRYHASTIFSTLKSINTNDIDPQCKIGNYRLFNFIEKLQKYIDQWFEFWNSTIVNERLSTFRQVFNLVEECSNPNLLEEMSIYIDDIASYCSIPIPALPDWQLCYRLKKQLQKNWNSLSKDSKTYPLFPDCFTPLSSHYHLILLGTLHTQDWSGLFNLLRFIDTAFEAFFIKQEKNEQRLLEHRLASYFSPFTPIPENSSLYNDILPVLNNLALYSNEHRTLDHHLDYLILVHPYAEEEQINNARLVIETIDKCQTIILPQSLLSPLTKIKNSCNQYLKLVGSLYFSENHNLSSNPGIYEWQRYTNQLSTGALCDSIQQFTQSLQHYMFLKNSLVSAIIPQDKNNTAKRNSSHLLCFLTVEAACDNLYSHFHALNEEVADTEIILDNLNIDTPSVIKNLFSSLLKGEEPSLTLNELTPSTLHALQSYPLISKAIEISFAIKNHV